ncbi:APOBEC-like N-terminal domain-containing protein [Globomyces pollinis-pini]|nr:APOBEC-like N-terminal domain-containing protein [Globomyces pollinis-pini]
MFKKKQQRVCRCSSTQRAPTLNSQISRGTDHTVRLEDVKEGFSLLGNKKQFCQAYAHIVQTPELSPNHSNWCQDMNDPCSTKPVIAMALLHENDINAPKYVARYTNCADTNHAEDFLLADKTLEDHLKAVSSPHILTLFLSLQPCHYSSNATTQSCTNNLLSWIKNSINLSFTKIELIFSYPYRTHWDVKHFNDQEIKRYGKAISNAKIGLKILLQSKLIKVRGMQADDWKVLLEYCDKSVQEDWTSVENPDATYGKTFKELRAEMDLFTNKVIDTYRANSF